MPRKDAASQSTVRQRLGNLGEDYVVCYLNCPVCHGEKPHSLLPPNTPCVDVICRSCNLQSQVKTISTGPNKLLPKTVLGGSWVPKEKSLTAGNFSPYFFILVEDKQVKRIYYLPASKQKFSIFKVRNPLSSKAKSPGWTGYQLDLRSIEKDLVELPLKNN